MNGGFSISAAIDVGKLVVKTRDTIKSSHAQLETKFESLLAVAGEVEKLISSSPDECVDQTWWVLRSGLAILASHGKCLSIAHAATGDLAEEQARVKVLFGELQAQLKGGQDSLPQPVMALGARICELTESDSSLVAQLLLALPLPTIYWELKEERSLHRELDDSPKVAPPPIVRLVAKLDNEPIATPQLINPERLYSIKFQVRGIGWPESAKSLELSLSSTCPHEEYSISKFELLRPKLDGNNEYQGELAGQIKFNTAQSSFFDDIVFRLRGAFNLSNDEYADVPIIGYHEIRLRVVNQERHPLMGANHRLDRHIEALLIELEGDCPSVTDEMAELQPLLQALNHLIARYAQEAIYKGVSTIPESEFHSTVLKDLGLLLGSDVQNHPNQAGGIGDIRFRGVITELKVEKSIGDRHQIAQKYAAQATQYEGVEARQVSVLLVLDLTPKNSPPGDLRNDILLVDVPTHGGAEDKKPYPSKAIVVVMNGNVRSPSDYSK